MVITCSGVVITCSGVVITCRGVVITCRGVVITCRGVATTGRVQSSHAWVQLSKEGVVTIERVRSTQGVAIKKRCREVCGHHREGSGHPRLVIPTTYIGQSMEPYICEVCTSSHLHVPENRRKIACYQK